MSGDPPVTPGEKGTKLVGVDDRGVRVGEDHPRARLTDAEVDLIHELYRPTDGAEPLSMREIARKFEVSVSHVSDLLNFKKRVSYPTGFKRVRIATERQDAVPVVVRLGEQRKAIAHYLAGMADEQLALRKGSIALLLLQAARLVAAGAYQADNDV